MRGENVSKDLKKAVASFDWPKVSSYLQELPPEVRNNEIQLLLDIVFRDGYLILRRPDETKEVLRDRFITDFICFAASHLPDSLVMFYKSRADQARLTETAYREILASLRSGVLSQVSSEDFLWIVIRECEMHGRSLHASLASSRIGDEAIDLVAGTVSIASVNGEVNPDRFSDSMMRTLTATIKMLAYEEGWFAGDGAVEIPSASRTDQLHRNIGQANYYFAEAWNQLERSDGRCRYFGGSVIEVDRTAQINETKPEKLICFEFQDGGEINFHIAGERLKHLFNHIMIEMLKTRPVIKTADLLDSTNLPPEQYVSFAEAHAALSLSNLFYKWIGDVEEEYGGLTICEWLRGYSILSNLGITQLESSPGGVCVCYNERFLEHVLFKGGLSPEKSSKFIKHVTFGRDTSDVFDAPLLRCRDGLFYLVAGAVFASHLALVILSRLSSLRCELAWKGSTLEQDIIDLFRSQGLPASSIKRKVNGEECEIDCVAMWDDILFVFECKNYSLPNDNAQAEYWFEIAQENAAKQAKSKAEALYECPNVVAEALKVSPTWTRIVPVVLNGAPYSMVESIDGVFIYDGSALHRFFEMPFIGLMLNGEPVADKTVTFWAGDHPKPRDLLEQLSNPAQVAFLQPYFYRRELAFRISERFFVKTITIERRPTDFDLSAKP